MRYSLPLLLLPFAALPAADWPGWRGPTGQGQAVDKGLPLHWDAKTGKNVLWKAPLPGGGKGRPDNNQSSPTVVGGKVFVTASAWPAGRPTRDFPTHHVLCFDAATGKPLWDRTVEPGPWSRAADLRGGYTVPTPAADEKRVFAVFGSSVVAAFDHAGTPLWRKEIRPTDFDVAMASSPVLYRGLVILQLDGVNRSSRIVAYDGKTGEVRWKQNRPDLNFSHSTPVLVRVRGRPQLLVAANTALQGVDPEDGKLVWSCDAPGDVPSPVFADELAYVDGGRGGKGVCVEPVARGDGVRRTPRWTVDNVPQGFSSPLVVGGTLYRLVDPGVLRSYDLKTGAPGEAVRVPGVRTAVSPFATPEGRIYLAGAGKSVVFQAGGKLKRLASSDLGDPSDASPAVAGGRIYLKGRRYLWCVGAKE